MLTFHIKLILWWSHCDTGLGWCDPGLKWCNPACGAQDMRALPSVHETIDDKTPKETLEIWFITIPGCSRS